MVSLLPLAAIIGFGMAYPALVPLIVAGVRASAHLGQALARFWQVLLAPIAAIPLEREWLLAAVHLQWGRLCAHIAAFYPYWEWLLAAIYLCWGWLCVFTATITRPWVWLSNWVWQFTGSNKHNRDLRTVTFVGDDDAYDLRHYPVASRRIILDVAALCRARLGLERSTDPRDVAVRTMVRKEVFGILSDRDLYPDLRLGDAARLTSPCSALACVPSREEALALDLESSAPCAVNRRLARGAWGGYPETWLQWFRSCLGCWTGRVYLPPVQEPSF